MSLGQGADQKVLGYILLGHGKIDDLSHDDAARVASCFPGLGPEGGGCSSDQQDGPLQELAALVIFWLFVHSLPHGVAAMASPYF